MNKTDPLVDFLNALWRAEMPDEPPFYEGMLLEDLRAHLMVLRQKMRIGHE